MNEELQSTRGGLQTSAEELQSLKEEISTVNIRLEETLCELETVNVELDNLLRSTDAIAIFLDRDMSIKRLTAPAMRLFNMTGTCGGNALSDVSRNFDDHDLLTDARRVLEKTLPDEKEVCAREFNRWYLRRILPCRTRDKRIAGVVITFIDITERKRLTMELREAKELAERANQAKNGFLTCASHDLRQPLQTLTLLNGVLLREVETPRLTELVKRQADTLSAINRLLPVFHELSRIDTAMMAPDIRTFPVAVLLDRIRTEFRAQPDTGHPVLRVVSSSASIHSDADLLFRILQNLVANAIKVTGSGRVLVGCRRGVGGLRIEVRGSGRGFPRGQSDAVNEEFTRSGRPARHAAGGSGASLYVSQYLAQLLQHRLNVRSGPDGGSIFAVEVPLETAPGHHTTGLRGSTPDPDVDLAGTRVLLLVDDPGVLVATCLLLNRLGLVLDVASGAEEASAGLQGSGRAVDLIIADYLRPDGKGSQAIQRVREALGREIPALLIAGDTVTGPVRDREVTGCEVLRKPVDANELIARIHRLLGG